MVAASVTTVPILIGSCIVMIAAAYPIFTANVVAGTVDIIDPAWPTTPVGMAWEIANGLYHELND